MASGSGHVLSDGYSQVRRAAVAPVKNGLNSGHSAVVSHDAQGQGARMRDMEGRRTRRRPDLATAFVPARTPTEGVLAGLWSSVLGVPSVGTADGFLELGGDSLLGTWVVSAVREALGVELELAQLFELRTVARLALTVDGALAAGGSDRPAGAVPPLVRTDRQGLSPTSFAQQ